MIETIKNDACENTDQATVATVDEAFTPSTPECTEETQETVDGASLEETVELSDENASTDENEAPLENEDAVVAESTDEAVSQENEDQKRIEELTATLEQERAEHIAQINSLKKEITALSPLPNFEKEMIEEMIALREGYFRMKRNYEEKEETFFDKAKTIRLIDDIASQLETILFNYAVEMSHSNASDPYNPRIHQAVKVIPTDDEEKGGKVESSLGELYMYKGRTIQKEKVNVYKFNK